MKQVFYLFIGILLITGSIYLFLKQPAPQKYVPKVATSSPKYIDIRVGEVPVRVEVARTINQRKLGLSNRENLPNGEGMLFDFEVPDIYGIWMKDMKFNIDLIWISEGMVVTSTKANISPESFPEVFYSDNQVRYVLEVPAGFVENNNIQVGDRVNLRT